MKAQIKKVNISSRAIAWRMVIDMVKDKGNLKPLRIMIGRKKFQAGMTLFRGKFVDYIDFCRMNGLTIRVTGDET